MVPSGEVQAGRFARDHLPPADSMHAPDQAAPGTTSGDEGTVKQCSPVGGIGTTGVIGGPSENLTVSLMGFPLSSHGRPYQTAHRRNPPHLAHSRRALRPPWIGTSFHPSPPQRQPLGRGFAVAVLMPGLAGNGPSSGRIILTVPPNARAE